MATAAIAEGEPVMKFGQIIGFATGADPAGRAHPHAQLRRPRLRPRLPLRRGAPSRSTCCRSSSARTFQGYRRKNGKVGTRNYIGILTSVNCSASVARFIADAVNRSGILDDYPNIDGVVPFVMGTGCGMAGRGSEGFEVLQRTEWGYANHPNLAGALMVGLGCEVMQIPDLVEDYGLKENEMFRTMTIQATGGTRKTVERGVAMIKEMLPSANAVQRETVPVSELMLALQCGGSDGYSGITANPALGYAADLLVEQGGTAVLCETPEIYGAEHLLTRRAATREIGEKLVDIINWWEDYTARNKGEMNNNPSPGNKAGGLTTILEKSLGAAAKGGTTTLRGVYPLRRADRRRAASSSWIRPATTRSASPARWPRAATSSPSPPAAARPSASSRRRRSSSPPTTTPTSARPRTWTSTAATSSTASPSRRRAARSSRR